MTKKLFRTRKNRIFGGVAGGLGEYFDVDPIIIRAIFIASAFAWGLSILVYIGLWIFVPQREFVFDSEIDNDMQEIFDDSEEINTNSVKTQRKIIAGSLLIAFGFIILIDKFMPSIDILKFWPIVLVLIGVYIIYRASFKTRKI